MTRRRRNGFDYVALALDDFALRAAGLGHHEIARRPRRGARLAHYWAERVREHDRDAYARGYADAERDAMRSVVLAAVACVRWVEAHDTSKCMHGTFSSNCRACASEPPHFPVGIDEFASLISAVHRFGGGPDTDEGKHRKGRGDE